MAGPDYSWRLADRTLNLGRRTLVMGIVNVTPDSFHDGGRYYDPAAAVDQALALVDQGADILDIGGESTRPFSDGITVGEETDRVAPVIGKIVAQTDAPISVDTRKAKVAEAALQAGAVIINDVTGLTYDPEMIPLAAKTKAGVVLMHMRGTPKDMQTRTGYDHLIGELIMELSLAVKACLDGGVDRSALMIDPGIGFAKEPAHNLTVLDQLPRFADLGLPLLVGASRKSFIGHALAARNLADQTENRLSGSLAAAVLAAAKGAAVVRVHDVAETVQALAVCDAVTAQAFISK